MSRSITLGQYIPGHSFLHRLDPRFKLAGLLILLAALFTARSFTGLALLGLLAVGLAGHSAVPLSHLLRGIRPIFYIVLFTLVIYALLTPGGVVLLRLGPVTIESTGLSEGLFVVLRLLLLVWFSLMVTLTTTPLAFTEAIEFFLRPLKLAGLPVSEIALIMTIALRFIPTLMEESQRIMRAQMARGADFESGGFFRRAGNLIPLIVPLFISAFRRADELALAMEARGYRIGARRTRLRRLPVTWHDWVALAFVTALFILALVYAL